MRTRTSVAATLFSIIVSLAVSGFPPGKSAHYMHPLDANNDGFVCPLDLECQSARFGNYLITDADFVRWQVQYAPYAKRPELEDGPLGDTPIFFYKGPMPIRWQWWKYMPFQGRGPLWPVGRAPRTRGGVRA